MKKLPACLLTSSRLNVENALSPKLATILLCRTLKKIPKHITYVHILCTCALNRSDCFSLSLISPILNLICLFSLPVCVLERANLPRNMIENSMFEEEPDVVDLAADSTAFPVRSPHLIPRHAIYTFIWRASQAPRLESRRMHICSSQDVPHSHCFHLESFSVRTCGQIRVM